MCMEIESAKGPGSAKAGPEEPLLAPGTQEKGKAQPQAGVTEKEKLKNKLKKIVHPFFRRYDATKDNQLNKTKFSLLKKEVGGQWTRIVLQWKPSSKKFWQNTILTQMN